jgi:hypothetical protein
MTMRELFDILRDNQYMANDATAEIHPLHVDFYADAKQYQKAIDCLEDRIMKGRYLEPLNELEKLTFCLLYEAAGLKFDKTYPEVPDALYQ